MRSRNPHKKHFCTSCELEWKSFQLLKMYRCPFCKRFTTPKSKTDLDFERLRTMVEMQK